MTPQKKEINAKYITRVHMPKKRQKKEVCKKIPRAHVIPPKEKRKILANICQEQTHMT